jgi:hypothetical protein
MSEILTINDKEYTFEYDFNARVKAEAATGINLFSPDANAATFRAITWSMLIPNHPDLTIEDAGKLLNRKSMSKVIAIVTKLSESEE